MWIADCLAAMREAGQTRIEATADAETDWIRHVAKLAGGTLPLGCNSWYLGANIPGKPRVFMPYVGCPSYRAICTEVAEEGYKGFALT